MKERKNKFQEIVIEGSAFEAGKQLGSMMRQNPEYVKALTAVFPGQEKLSMAALSERMEEFEAICPGINEEIKGFAHGAGVAIRDVIIYYAYMKPTRGQCSLMAVLPEKTENKAGMLGRNYEFGWDDTSVLIESKIDGQYAQIGFGCQLFGRFDGMNEHGLCIATAAGVINPEYTEEGFVFPIIVRAILNQCKTVEEALTLYKKIKVADFRNFMIMDADGEAVLIEAAASANCVKKINLQTPEKVLFATNHYESELLKDRGYYTPKHSHIRYFAIQNKLAKEKGCISENRIKDLLAKPMPEGVCCHHYEDGMGTMWSEVFYPEKREIDICFGAPAQKEWKKYNFTRTMRSGKNHEFYVILTNETAPEDFWQDDQEGHDI